MDAEVERRWDARTAIHGSGTHHQSGNKPMSFRLRASSCELRAAGKANTFAASLCFARSYLSLMLMISFGGGFRWSGHLRHGCRS
ncbi:hypothetical protein QWZ13_14650 [Reinekea marina]|uniref:hypothetical protein n=1 Tax=Reinekea marina TaxID=1310421 RepID=UPI0025B3BA0B|nr:hypothetical protein [Reinekea marina]MDN3650157.1 hypothetical protein [Reinekea marina]